MPSTVLGTQVGEQALLDAELARNHSDGWLAMGVLSELTVVPVGEVTLDPDAWDRLMIGGGEWCDEVAAILDVSSPADLLAVSVTIVRGLEFVEGMDEARALMTLSAPGVRAAVVEPSMVLDGSGRTRSVQSPAALWLSELPLFDGQTPVSVRLSGDERLVPFFAEVADASGLDVELLAALGVHTTLDAWIARPGGLDELPDPPARLRALIDGQWVVVDADHVVVAVAPHHTPVLTQPFIPGDAALAELFELSVSDDARCGAETIHGTGTLGPVPDALRSAHVATEYREHDSLTVGETEVDWWVTDDGEVHACTVDGLARGLAWASGQWNRRWELAAALSGTAPDERHRIESYYDA
jgi:hypothetical protein